MQSKSFGNKITKIKVNKNKTSITFSDKSKLSINNDTHSSFYLYVGKELSLKEYDEIIKVDNASKYFKYALSLLSKSVYTEFKMREKLYARGASKGEVDRLIIVLKNNDLINDDAFIEDYICYANEKGIGENKIRTALASKGVFSSSIDKLTFSHTNELRKAKKHLKKLNDKYDKYNELSKREHIKSALYRLGFSKATVIEVIDELPKGNQKEEMSKLHKDYLSIKNRYSKKYKGKELKEKIIRSLINKGYKFNDIVKEVI